MRTVDARYTGPSKWGAGEHFDIDAPSAEGNVGYGAMMCYTGSEWVTEYCGGDETRYIAVVRGGRGKVNGERWYFCDFEGLRTYIECNINMRRQNHDRSDK
jgi:hypothetical protein